MQELAPPPQGHRRQPRERFRAVGRRGLSDHELLELLLTYALPRRDTKPLAKSLLRSFEGFCKSLKWIIENEGMEAGLRFLDTAGLPLVSRTETPQHEPAP